MAVPLSLVWSAIAIICDYLLIVKLLNPPDVYLYCLLTLALAVAAAWLRRGTGVPLAFLPAPT
ncbi:MAG: hypothetical protein WCE69_09610 [Aestuariivirga sp.]